ncbi:unnamed protein product [Enterobius vermicularis]|uniref:CAAX prenyl protease 2 n=1 Tax=Enterobius vermicularis TaxID=51028 RepID=A0A0N4VGH4_ENTVE|nr:unnamed protein product [Enterobius vermicularis]
MLLPLHLSLATTISLSYVGFLYAFDYNGTDRNHPKSIKRRFCGAVVCNLISILTTYILLAQHHAQPLAVMGLHTRGMYAAFIFSLLLTSCCYLGNWVMLWYDGQIEAYFDFTEWRISFTSLPWFRDNVMAPITEELAFRACAASLIREVFSPLFTIAVAPLPFSLSHFHHVFDDAKKGSDIWSAMRRRAFQALYSYVFGCYATFLFVRTENIISAIVSHSICNGMGLPMFNYIEQYQSRLTRVVLWSSHITGFCIFLLLLMPLTEPYLYTA